MKRCIVIILFTLPFLSFGQQIYNQKIITKSTNKVVKKIGKVNELMGDAVYYEGIRPKQYDNFEELRKIASKEELIELTNHPNGVIQCYAFWALSYDKSVDLFPIVLNHINNNKLVKTQFGCIGGQEMVGDFFISIAEFDSIQSVRLDSILIYSDSKLYARSRAIYRAKPTESLYPKIRELFIDNDDQDALVTLAKYRKPEDVQLILNHKEDNDEYFYVYKAIQEFPHEDFLPLLERNLIKILDETHQSVALWRQLYKAIAIYKNQKAVELLTIPFTQVKYENMREYHIDCIYNAIQENISEIYDPLLWKLWIEENRMTPNVYQYLLKKDSIKVLELTENVINSDKIYSATIGLDSDDFDSTEKLASMMLDLVIKNNYDFGIKIIRENIKSANVHQISIFTDKVIELKDKSFIDLLFERLENEDNPYVYLKIAEALLSYHDNAINERILETRKINDNLNKGWGSEALNKLLIENKDL